MGENLRSYNYHFLGLSLFIIVLPIFVQTASFQLSLLKFILTFVVYVIITGNSLGRTILKQKKISLLGSVVIGIIAQSFNLFIFFVIDSITFGSFIFLFHFLIPILTVIELLSSFQLNNNNERLFFDVRIDFKSYGFIIALVFQISALFILGSFMAPDAALYCDIARYTNNTGTLGSLVLNDGFPNPISSALVLIPHIGTVLGFTFSFFLGGIDGLFAQIFTLILGSAIIGLILRTLKEWPIVLRVLILPLLIFIPSFLQYSTSIFGPSMYSVFIAISALTCYGIALNEDEKSVNRKLLLAITGLCIYIEYFVWGGTQFPLLVAIGLMTIFDLKKKDKLGVIPLFLSIAIIGGVAFLPRISASVQIWFILVIFYIVIFLTLAVFRITPIQDLSILTFTTLLFFQISFIRSYLHPEIYLVAATQGPGASSLVIGIIPTIDSISISFQYLIYNIPLILLLLLAPAILKINDAEIPLVSLAGGYLVFQFLGRGVFTLAESRFYVGFILILMALAVSGSWNTLQIFCKKKKKIDTRITRISKSGRNLLTTFVIVSMIMISLNAGHYIQNKATADQYSLGQNGVHHIQSWFAENSIEDDSILVLGSSRYWAWFLNRVAIGFHSWENGMLVPESEMNVTHLVSHLDDYSVAYVLVDTSSLWNRRYRELAILYDDPIVGQSFIVQNENISFTLQCKLKSDVASNNGTIIVFSVNENPSIEAYFKDEFSSSNRWYNNTNLYPLEDGDNFSIGEGYLQMNLRASQSWDFDQIFSNNISIPHIDTLFETRFRVNSSAVSALYITFSEEMSITGNWIQWSFFNPEPNSWISAKLLLSDLIQAPEHHSPDIIQHIESIAITGLLENGEEASIEIDYIHVGFIQIQNEEVSTARISELSNSDFIISRTDLVCKTTDSLMIIPGDHKAIHRDESFWRCRM